MRLLAAGLLLAALLVLPVAAADTTTTLALSGASGIVDLTTAPNATVPISVTFTIDQGFACTSDAKATVDLKLNSTGPITANLDAQSVTFNIPATDPTDTTPTGSAKWTQTKTLNLSVARTAIGNGTATIEATFKGGDISGCNAAPSVGIPPSTQFTKSSKSLNVSTQALVGNTTTPTPTTPTPTSPTGTTPTTTTAPVSSSPIVSSSPTVETTPSGEDKGFLGLPGPEVPLVVAGVVGLAVLLRRRS